MVLRPTSRFLDADDVWTPDKLAEQVDLLDSMPDVAMVAGAIEYWYSWDPSSTQADRVVLTGGMADRRLDPQSRVDVVSAGVRRKCRSDRPRPAHRLRRGRRVRRAFPRSLRRSGILSQDLPPLSHLYLRSNRVPLATARQLMRWANIPNALLASAKRVS